MIKKLLYRENPSTQTMVILLALDFLQSFFQVGILYYLLNLIEF